MSNATNIIKISLALSTYYLRARKINKNNDFEKSYQIVKDLADNVINVYKKNVEVINRNLTYDLRGSIILSNHQENLDIFLLINAFASPIKFVAKKELFDIPFFKTFIEASHSHAIDRNDPRQGVKLFKEVVDDVDNNGSNVVIFPEGTRSKTDLMSDFNSGLFNIIRRVNMPLIPVYIDGSYLDKQPDVKVIIGEEIKSEEYKSLKGHELKALVYQKICALKVEYGNKAKQYTILGLGDSLTFGEDYQHNYTEGFFYKFTKQLEVESLLNKQYNLAIPGSSIRDLSMMIDENNYNELVQEHVNETMSETRLDELLDQVDDSIENIIKKTDCLIMSCGANDLLKVVQKSKVTNQEIFASFDDLYEQMSKLISKIIKINPKIKIIMIGLYFPYPHVVAFERFNHINALDLYYNKLERKYRNFKRVSIYQEFAANKNAFLPDKRNIHPSDEGYALIKSKIATVFQENF